MSEFSVLRQPIDPESGDSSNGRETGADPRASVLVVACGALAHEITHVIRASHWQHISVRCLPPELHNRPERIPGAVREVIRANRSSFRAVFVAYGDCGTGGMLDRVLAEERVERIPGAHCYEFFAGAGPFAALADAEPGTFYLTDFLARHFDRLVWRGLGLDRHPELRGIYFAHYRRLVYLAQGNDPRASEMARAAAKQLGLTFERVVTGYGDLETSLVRVFQANARWRS